MHVTHYKRHSAKCKHRNDKTYKRCDCSVWLAWGKKRKSADTPFWETAHKKARAIERQFEDAELGIAAPQAIAPVLVEDAIKSFLDEKRGRISTMKPSRNTNSPRGVFWLIAIRKA